MMQVKAGENQHREGSNNNWEREGDHNMTARRLQATSKAAKEERRAIMTGLCKYTGASGPGAAANAHVPNAPCRSAFDSSTMLTMEARLLPTCTARGGWGQACRHSARRQASCRSGQPAARLWPHAHFPMTAMTAAPAQKAAKLSTCRHAQKYTSQPCPHACCQVSAFLKLAPCVSAGAPLYGSHR
jgi:hypothetical protein